MSQNPYLTRPGFGLRYNHAKNALESFGQDEFSRPYSRAFDNCFENFDGDAVVWALMHDAVAKNNGDLAEGIKRMGKNVWPQWLEVYEQRGAFAPQQLELNLSSIHTPHGQPKSPRQLSKGRLKF